MVGPKVHIRSRGFADVTFQAGAVATLSNEAPGKVLRLEGGTVREVREVAVGELAVSGRARVGLDALRHQSGRRFHVGVRESAAVGSVRRVVLTALVADAGRYVGPGVPGGLSGPLVKRRSAIWLVVVDTAARV